MQCIGRKVRLRALPGAGDRRVPLGLPGHRDALPEHLERYL